MTRTANCTDEFQQLILGQPSLEPSRQEETQSKLAAIGKAIAAIEKGLSEGQKLATRAMCERSGPTVFYSCINNFASSGGVRFRGLRLYL